MYFTLWFYNKYTIFEWFIYDTHCDNLIWFNTIAKIWSRLTHKAGVTSFLSLKRQKRLLFHTSTQTKSTLISATQYLTLSTVVGPLVPSHTTKYIHLSVYKHGWIESNTSPPLKSQVVKVTILLASIPYKKQWAQKMGFTITDASGDVLQLLNASHKQPYFGSCLVRVYGIWMMNIGWKYKRAYPIPPVSLQQ